MPPSFKQKKEFKNERYIDLNFDSCCMDFLADMAIASHGCLHLSEASLSGGQEEKN